MRKILPVFVATLAAMAVMAPVDAKKSPTRAHKAKAHHAQSHKSARFDPNDPKCVEAESLDPGGNYSAYPCWARAALAPKTDGPWR